MRAMVRGELRSHSWKWLGLSAVLLLLSGQGQLNAASSKAQEAPTSEAKPQLASPSVTKPVVVPATEEPSPASPVPQTPPPALAPAAPTTEQPSPANSSRVSHLVIKLRERRVYVYRGDKAETSYPIAVGKSGWETPTGTFKVLQMIRDPAWQHPWNVNVIPPGPNNPLGTRWIGFWTDGKNFIGFHGTPNERLIGQAVSHGCIRMRNRDVVALFEQVAVGTPVIVEH